MVETDRSFTHMWRTGFSLAIMTMGLNILGLTLPLASQLIFNRILPSGGSATLPFVVGGVIVITCLEAMLRFARSYIMLESEQMHSSHLLNSLLSRLISSRENDRQRGAAQSLDYFARIAQVADKRSGGPLVAIIELVFLPLILIAIYVISPIMALLITLCLVIAVPLTLKQAHVLQRTATVSNIRIERRYRFLLSVLSSIHVMKALAIENKIQRRYEAMQRHVSVANMQIARIASTLMSGATLTNNLILVACLMYGAVAVSRGDMTLGAVAAILLLSGRLVGPLQRAIFILTQMRDLCDAERILEDAMQIEAGRPATSTLSIVHTGTLRARDLNFEVFVDGQRITYQGIDLDIRPGELVALSGASRGCRTLFKVLAGIEKANAGEIFLDGKPLDAYGQNQLNQAIAYVPRHTVMFHGTIRDNITRFGEVPLEDAMAVLAILDLTGTISELPGGIDTDLNGMPNENVSAGLCQQLALVRALVYRPKLLLIDNVDMGLDRTSYARLQRFLGGLRGQATMVIFSDDRNLTANADRRLLLSPNGIKADLDHNVRRLSTYRSLKL